MKTHLLKLLLPATLLSAFLYVLATYPTLSQPQTLLPGTNDALLFPWNLYQFQTLLLAGQNPFFTPDIFYPTGANLLAHSYSTFSDLLALLLPTQNFLLKVNLLLLFGVIVSTAVTSFLIKQVFKTSSFAAILGALVFSTSPFILSSLAPGHYPYTQSYFLPLTLLALWWWQKSPQWSKAIMLSFIFWFGLINEYYQGIFAGFLICLFLITLFLTKSFPKPSFSQTLLLILFLALPAIPLFFWADPVSLAAARTIPGLGISDICRANLARFLLHHPLGLLQFLPSLGPKLRGLAHFDSPSVSAGFSVLLLSLFGFLTFRKLFWAKLSALIILTGILFAAGPTIKFGPITLLPHQLSPYWWFFHIPLLKNLRCPIRADTLIMLGLSLLTALGFEALRKRLSSPTLFLIFLIVLIEQSTLGLPITKPSTPKVYQFLSQVSDSNSLLEFPSGFGDGFVSFGTGQELQITMQQTYLQTLHHHPRIGGHLSRIPDAVFKRLQNEVFISDLWRIADLGPKANTQIYSPAQIKQLLTNYQIGYLILWPAPYQNLALEYARSQLTPFIKQSLSLDGFWLLIINPRLPLPSHQNPPLSESPAPTT